MLTLNPVQLESHLHLISNRHLAYDWLDLHWEGDVVSSYTFGSSELGQLGGKSMARQRSLCLLTWHCNCHCNCNTAAFPANSFGWVISLRVSMEVLFYFGIYLWVCFSEVPVGRPSRCTVASRCDFSFCFLTPLPSSCFPVFSPWLLVST